MRQVETADALNYLYPQPLAFLTAVGPGGTRNAMAAGWLMQASFEPPVLAVAVSPKNYTHRLIEETDRFAVSLAGQGQTELILRLGTISSGGTDKLAELNVAAKVGPHTGCPLIEGAAVHFECQVEKRISVGDHSVFFGRIVAGWVPEAPIRKIDNFGAQRFAAAEPAP